MPIFSINSERKLLKCHTDLQAIMNMAIKYIDFSIVCTYRGQEEQDKAFASGHSKLKYPDSKHNKTPSMAIDIQPFPSGSKHKINFYILAGVVLTCAKILLEEGKILHRLRWGGDWDGDFDFTDNKFNDLYHFEIM